MRVKIGNTIYDSATEPIMLIFETEGHRRHVAKQLSEMPERSGVRLYVQAPEDLSIDEINKFMDVEGFTITETKKIH
jgi:hypothetical protein